MSEGSYVEKVRRGERPSPHEALAFLRAWHARHPGSTARNVRPWRTSVGGSSYEVLAACVPDGTRTVVDLACGDGELALEVLKSVPGANVVGVDVSEEDLVRARTRAPAARARFICTKADALPVATESAGAVLCHYALMLLSPLDAVVSEIARVLAPGGVFAAIVPMQWNAEAFSAPLAKLVDEVRKADLPAFPELGLGDPRVRTTEGIRTVFDERAGFTALQVEDVTLFAPDTPGATFERMQSLYWFDLLSERGRERLRVEGLPLLEKARGADGNVPVRFELKLIHATRASDGDDG